MASSDPLGLPGNTLDGFKVDISHQEMDRIIRELELIYQSQPTTWLPVEGLGMMMMTELGYEDMDELEDALKGTWPQFLGALPHVELGALDPVTGKQLPENAAQLEARARAGVQKFRMKPPPPPEECVPTKLSIRVTTREDLWRVCLKAPHATACIPELEFEVGPDSKRHIDSIYNHVAQAIFNLTTHMRNNKGAFVDADTENIADTLAALTGLLDLERPWTWEVKDPNGMSEIKPIDGVVKTRIQLEDM